MTEAIVSAPPTLTPAGSGSAIAVERLTLDNGLRVVLLPDHRLPLIALRMSYDAGSRHDPDGLWGLAHLTEHLFYNGPGVQPGWAERLHRLGGWPGAVTSCDRTCYTVLLPAHRLEQGLRIEAERQAAAMDSRPGASWRAALDIQRRVLRAERCERAVSRPHELAYECLHRLLFSPGHPYRRPPSGMAAAIESITCEDVRAFVRQRYTPDRAVLVLAGDLPAAVDRLVNDALGGFTFRVAPDPAGSSRAPGGRGERLAVALDRGPKGRAYLAYRLNGFRDREWYAASLLAMSLAVGRSSPLQRLLVGGGLAREIRASLISHRDASTLVFAATSEAGVTAARLAEELVATLDRLLRDGTAGAGLPRARRKALTDHYVRIQKLAGRAALAVRFAAFRNRPELLASEHRRLEAVDEGTLRPLVERWLRREGRAVLTVRPQGAGG